MKLLVVLLALASALPAKAAGVSKEFDCTFERLVVARATGSSWDVGAPSEFEAKVDFRRISLSLTDTTITIRQAGDPMHIEGGHPVVSVDNAHVVWSSNAVGYCRVVDAQCVPSVDFAEVPNDTSALIISLSTHSKGYDALQRLASLQFLYRCTARQGKSS